MLRRNSDRVRPPKIPGQSFHDCEGSGGTASQSRCESHECVHTHDTHSLHCTQIRKTPDRANVEIAPISVCTNSRAPEIPPRAETLGDTNPWHNSPSCVHHGSASQIPTRELRQLRCGRRMTCLILFIIQILFFNFFIVIIFLFAVTLMLRARSCQSWGEPSLTGPKRIWERWLGETRRYAQIMYSALKKGKIWENGQKAIFLEFRVFALGQRGSPGMAKKGHF